MESTKVESNGEKKLPKNVVIGKVEKQNEINLQNPNLGLKAQIRVVSKLSAVKSLFWGKMQCKEEDTALTKSSSISQFLFE